MKSIVEAIRRLFGSSVQSERARASERAGAHRELMYVIDVASREDGIVRVSDTYMKDIARRLR